MLRFLSSASRRVNLVSKIRAFSSEVVVNKRSYGVLDVKRQHSPVVVVCVDGCAPDYLDAAKDVMPHWNDILQRRDQQGNYGLASCAMPSYTNPNNISIITGVPPAVHGISGNYFYNEETGLEETMNDPKYIQCDTILSVLSQQPNTKVVAVTAKDKLRRMLTKDLNVETSFGFSVEKLNQEDPDTVALLQEQELDLATTLKRPAPGIYEADISIYCVEAGISLIEATPSTMNQIYYLSTTDYVQHKHAPGTPEANEFMGKLDSILGRLDALGATIGVTADHGMNTKVGYSGNAKIVYLEDVLGVEHTATTAEEGAEVETRVILPITDPYLLHHGGLGGYGTVYLKDKSETNVNETMNLIRQEVGIQSVMSRVEAVKALDLPADRIGDIVVIGDQNTVLGLSESKHDLTQVPNLRSHGSLEEQAVPFWVNKPLHPEYARKLTRGKVRNYDMFDFLLNGVQRR